MPATPVEQALDQSHTFDRGCSGPGSTKGIAGTNHSGACGSLVGWMSILLGRPPTSRTSAATGDGLENNFDIERFRQHGHCTNLGRATLVERNFVGEHNNWNTAAQRT
jgi:hypothetical protein